MSLSRLLPLLLLLSLVAPAYADIYKYYDSNGNLVLSDTAPKDKTEKVEKVEVKPIMTVPALKDSKHGAAVGDKPVKKARGDYQITIQSPGAEATYQRNGDPIPVGFTVDPSLEEGHHIKLLLDGAAARGLTQLQSDQLDRGSHQFTVQVVDKDDKVLKSSSVTFYIHQPSVLNPSAPQPQSTPKP